MVLRQVAVMKIDTYEYEEHMLMVITIIEVPSQPSMCTAL